MPESNSAAATVIQQVRETDGNMTRQPAAVQSPPVNKVA
jgi:hypothetical protein